MLRVLLPALLLLVACDEGVNEQPAPPAGWELGPTINGKQYSLGAVDGNRIIVEDVHYVTRRTGPLSGTITLSFHLDAPLTGTIAAKDKGACVPARPATLSLYFQKEGDDWVTDGNRWWATFATVTLDRAGDYTITAPLDGPWTSVETMTAATHPKEFAQAKAQASRVGFTIGNCTGYGHGGTGPATLTITAFKAG